MPQFIIIKFGKHFKTMKLRNSEYNSANEWWNETPNDDLRKSWKAAVQTYMEKKGLQAN